MGSLKVMFLPLLVLSTITTMFNSHNIYLGYRLIWILPLVYTLMYVIVYVRALKLKSLRITTISVMFLFFLKNVLYPLLLSFSAQNYIGRQYISVTPELIEMSILLGAVEVIGASLFLLLITAILGFDRLPNLPCKLYLTRNRLDYYVFLFISIVLYVAYEHQNRVITFLSFSVSEGYTPIEGTLLTLIRQIVVIAFIIGFLLVLRYGKDKYEQTSNKKYINLVLLAAFANLSVIVGNRRSVQIFTTFLSVFLLVGAFPKYRKKIITVISYGGGLVIALMTLHRWGAFQYGSYLSAFESQSKNLSWLLNYIQIYLGAPLSTATAISAMNAVKVDVVNLLYDFGRLTFGLSFLLKGDMHITSELYNLYLYGGKQLTGQVISSTAYSYYYFGVLGVGVIICLNIWLSSIFEKLFRRSRSYESAYLYGYCLLRISLNILGTTPIILSVVTMQLGTFGLLVFFAYFFKRPRVYRQALRYGRRIRA